MARTLEEAPPSSAVARLLNRESASRALEPTRPDSAALVDLGGPGHVSAKARDVGSYTPRIKREFILTDDAEETFCEILALFRRTTRTRLTASQLFRAMLKAARRSMPALQYEAHQLGTLRLPGNGRHAQPQREAFEERLALAFARGLRDAAAIQATAPETAPTRDRTGR